MKLFIGTSGFQYKHWNDGVFYSPGVTDHLTYIYQHLNCVEINSSHYSIPKPSTVASWSSRVPENGKLVLKTPRSVTHRRRLRLESCNPSVTSGLDLMELFLDSTKQIPDKMRGPILMQISDRVCRDVDRLENMLALVKYHGMRVAFEARHETWFKKETFDVLEKYDSSLVSHDWSKYKCPLVITSNFIYLRRHGPKEMYDGSYGPKEMYDGSYSDAMLEADLRNIRLHNVDEAYVFFNNDGGGHAPRNAVRMLELTKELS